MSRKLFYKLRGRVEDGTVELSFFKSTPLFNGSSNPLPLSIRIYRRETDFVFNLDYEEYFDGLLPEEKDLIFEGALDAWNDRKYRFHDTGVRIGSTYAYWVSADQGDSPVGPVALRVRDTEVWWPHGETMRRMEALSVRYPESVRMETFGQTIRGHDICGLLIGNEQQRVACVGLIHPGESGPELILPAVERLVREHGELLRQVGLAVLPVVGIDERERLVKGHPGYLRTNFNGVDINRNFPSEWETTEYTYGLVTSDPDGLTYRGSRPASEPETRAVMAFIQAARPLCVFSFHSLASICGPNFFTSKFAKDDPGFARKLQPFVEAYTEGFYGKPAAEMQPSYVCSAGSLATWLYREWGIPGFDLEWDGREASKVSHTDRTTRELVREYQDRHYSGILRTLQSVVRL